MTPSRNALVLGAADSGGRPRGRRAVVHQPAPVRRQAKVGDCVSAPKSGKFTKVGCTDCAAAFQVIGSYPGHDGNQCDQMPATGIAVLASSGTSESILCLGPRK